MDCSCFTMTVFGHFGIDMPDSPSAQYGYGTPVYGAPQAGDLVFFSEDGSGIPTHVGIATGRGTVLIHASSYYGDVVESDMSYIPGYLGARRLL
jgi:cell wall-associated NlpC family hydrolase